MTSRDPLPECTLDETESHRGEYAVSCYLRHLKGILEEACIEVTPANRKQIDQAIHQIVGVTYKNCPETRKKLKQQLTGNEEKRQEFISQLKSAL